MERRCPACGGTNLQMLFGGHFLRCLNRECPDYRTQRWSKPLAAFLPDVASPSPTSPQAQNPGYGKLLGGGPLPLPEARSAKERLEQLKQLGIISARVDRGGLHAIADRIDKFVL